MIRLTTSFSLAAALFVSFGALAQAPADAPAGATGLCRDGTYWTTPTKRGACHGHQGVKDWYATTAASAAPTAAPAAAPAAPSAPAAAPSAPAAAPAAAAPVTHATPAPSTAPAAGGGPGTVWLNTSSNVYHCPADRYYGKTKNGAYMTESEAVAKGARPDHGKPCK